MKEVDSLRQFTLFIYSLTSLSQKKKVKAIRELFGYKDKKEKTVYYHKGLVDKTYSQKLAQNVILVPIINGKYFEDYFKANNIKYEKREIWLNE